MLDRGSDYSYKRDGICIQSLIGKSTMFEHLAEADRKIVTLDDPDIRYLAKTDPALSMQRFLPPVLIDKIQNVTFLTVVAARTPKPVIYEELANECGITSPTAKRWMSLLVSSHIVALVQP